MTVYDLARSIQNSTTSQISQDQIMLYDVTQSDHSNELIIYMIIHTIDSLELASTETLLSLYTKLQINET